MRERIEAMLAAIKDWQDDDEQGYMEATNLICGTLEGGLRELLVLVLPESAVADCTWHDIDAGVCLQPKANHPEHSIGHHAYTAPAAGETREAT